MTKPLLQLTEYVPARGVELTSADAGMLRRLVPSLSVAPAWDAPGAFDLVPGSEVGAISLDGSDVVVRPKVPTDRVLFLISYALDPARWQDRTAAYSTAPEIVEGMAALYAYELRRALRRGVLQGYREMEDALTTIRGRVRFDEQLRRRYDAPLPIEVRFDEYTEDTDLNRVLRAALWRLSRLRIRSRQVRTTLAFCSAVLADNVTLVDYTAGDLPDLRWNRLSQHYKPAAELARLVLAATSLEVSAGLARGTGFVIDMNMVFESFVRTALRDALGLDATSFPAGDQVRVPLDVGRKVRLEPDLSWWVSDDCAFVGDAKYKRISVKGINHPDLYQLLAYTIALDLPAGLLVYAAGEAERVEHTVVHSGKQLHVTTIDLSGSPTDILREVGRIAERVKTLAAARQPIGSEPVGVSA